MRIHISTGPIRKKPRIGDRRTTKKHGQQIRILSVVRDHVTGRIMGYDCTGGRQRYEWVTLDKLPAIYHYLLTQEEREGLK